MDKRKVRNINISDLGDVKAIGKISRLTQNDDGVCFRFEIPCFNDEFVMYAHECMQILKNAGINNYTFSAVILDQDSPNTYINSTTRVLSNDELENLLGLEFDAPKGAKVVVSEKYDTKFHDFSVTQAIQSNEFINSQVDYIKSFNLSPFEQYLMAYEIAAQFWYNDDNDANQKDWYQSRLLTSALTDVYFVCVAHSRLLSAILSGLDIKSQIQSLYVNVGTNGHRNDELHNNLMVYINDPKYKMNGVVLCDPCNDSFLMTRVKTKKGDLRFSAESRNTLILSAVGIDDVRNAKKSFTYDDEHFLRYVYQEPEALLGKDYKRIFDGFNDEYMGKYLRFFLSVHPEYEKDFDFDTFLTEKEYAYLIHDCTDFAKDKFDKLFEGVEVASAVEKADLSMDENSLVLYSENLVKLYMQTVVLKFAGIPEFEIDRYLKAQKPDVIKEIEAFDKDYEIDKKLEHNNYIAEKYGNFVSRVEPVPVRDIFTDYYKVSTDAYVGFMLYYFTKREKIAEIIQKIRLNSPNVEMIDYYRALATILQEQGYPEKKIISYVNDKLEETTARADEWFDSNSKNCFKQVANQMWEQQNKKGE